MQRQERWSVPLEHRAPRHSQRRLRFAAVLAFALVGCRGGEKAEPTPAPEPSTAVAAEAPSVAPVAVADLAPPGPDAGRPAQTTAPAATSVVAAPSAVNGVETAAPAAAATSVTAPGAKMVAPAGTGAETASPAAKVADTVGPAAKVAGTPAQPPSETQPLAASAKVASRSGGVEIPSTKDGILARGEADRVLKPGAPPSVRVLDTGVAPRDVLSYAFDAGKNQLGMKLDMSMGLSAGATRLPMTSMPRIVMLLDLAAGARASDTRVDGAIQGVSIEPGGSIQQKVADLMRPQIDLLRGVGISYTITSKGRVYDVSISLPPNLPKNAEQMLTGMSQSFESLTAPLPDEPVGIGARWRAVTRVVNSGADLLQFATYTLRSRDGKKVVIDLDITQLAATAAITPPGMPPGVAAKLTSFRSSGGGSTRLDMTSVVPEGGQLDMKTSMGFSVDDGTPGHKRQESSVDMTTAVGLYRPEK